MSQAIWDLVPQIIGAAGILIAAISLLLTYFSNSSKRKWDRLQLASNLLNRLYTDETLRFAWMIIDYDELRVRIPTALMFTSDKAYLDHNRLKQEQAFSRLSRDYSSPQMPVLKSEFINSETILYIAAFDTMLSYIQEVKVAKDWNLLSDDAIAPIYYIKHKIDDLGIFADYIDDYTVETGKSAFHTPAK